MEEKKMNDKKEFCIKNHKIFCNNHWCDGGVKYHCILCCEERKMRRRK
jgi:hypothetical protein